MAAMWGRLGAPFFVCFFLCSSQQSDSREKLSAPIMPSDAQQHKSAKGQALLVATLTSIPSRLKGLLPTLQSIIAQTRQPDVLLLCLPFESSREDQQVDLGELPPDVQQTLKRYPWMILVRPSKDFGPGTHTLGALEALLPPKVLHGLSPLSSGPWPANTVLVAIDDDHYYAPEALQALYEAQTRSGRGKVRQSLAHSFYVYFYKGIRVPQSSDMQSYTLEQIAGLRRYHQIYVDGYEAGFLMDDFWIGLYLHLRGVTMVRLTLEGNPGPVYNATSNADVKGLMHLDGRLRRMNVLEHSYDHLVKSLSSDKEVDAASHHFMWGPKVHFMARLFTLTESETHEGGQCSGQLLKLFETTDKAIRQLTEVGHALQRYPPPTSCYMDPVRLASQLDGMIDILRQSQLQHYSMFYGSSTYALAETAQGARPPDEICLP